MMTILLDDDNHQHPTFMNITEAFKALSEQSQPGDAVFVHFSGHGGRVLGSNDDVEAESYDEVIAPSDYTNSGLIRDTLIFKTLLAPMRYGVTVTILIDACDTGMVLDLPYSWSTRGDRSGSTAKFSLNDNFSFVRFLKVVKTLYESSTFTQLGKTVGSALTTGNAPKGLKDEEETYGNTEASKESNNLPGEDEVTRTTQVHNHGGTPLLSMFCGSPAAEQYETSKRGKKKKNVDQMTVDSRNPSLFEQMINCTLGHEVDDLDLFALDSYVKSESFSEDERSSDESARDEYESSPGRHRGNRGRSRRRKK